MNDKQIYLKKIFDVFSMGIKPHLGRINNIRDSFLFLFILPFVGLDRVSGSTIIEDTLENGFSPLFREQIDGYLEVVITTFSNNDSNSILLFEPSKQVEFFWLSILKNQSESFLRETNYKPIRGTEIKDNTVFGLAIDKRRQGFSDANVLIPFTPFKFEDGVCTQVLLANNATVNCKNIEVYITTDLMEKN